MEKAKSVVSGTEKGCCKSICFCTSEMPVHNSQNIFLITVIIFVCAGHGPSRSIMGEKKNMEIEKNTRFSSSF